MLVGITAVILILCTSPAVLAGTTYWVPPAGQQGDFLTGTNWSTGLPGTNLIGVIDNGGTASLSSGTSNNYGIDIGDVSGDSGTIIQTGGGMIMSQTIPGGCSGSVCCRGPDIRAIRSAGRNVLGLP